MPWASSPAVPPSSLTAGAPLPSPPTLYAPTAPACGAMLAPPACARPNVGMSDSSGGSSRRRRVIRNFPTSSMRGFSQVLVQYVYAIHSTSRNPIRNDSGTPVVTESGPVARSTGCRIHMNINYNTYCNHAPLPSAKISRHPRSALLKFSYDVTDFSAVTHQIHSQSAKFLTIDFPAV
jgi:hypothetical protein